MIILVGCLLPGFFVFCCYRNTEWFMLEGNFEVQAPCHGQGQLSVNQAAQSPIQPYLAHFPEWAIWATCTTASPFSLRRISYERTIINFQCHGSWGVFFAFFLLCKSNLELTKLYIYSFQFGELLLWASLISLRGCAAEICAIQNKTCDMWGILQLNHLPSTYSCMKWASTEVPSIFWFVCFWFLRAVMLA